MSFFTATKEFNGRLIAPYQHDGVEWLINRELDMERPGGLLCDEMGLGKTAQLVATMLGNPKPRTLILVPKSIVDQWKSEIAKFAPQLNVFVHSGKARANNVTDLDGFHVVIAPYSLITNRNTRSLTVLHGVAWDRLILDEAHEVRNPKSKRFESVKSIRSTIRWMVTGTPVMNNLTDFAVLLAMLRFSKNECLRHYTSICDKYVLRRTKEDLAAVAERLRLPECDFQNVMIPLKGEHLELYKTRFDEAGDIIRRAMHSDNKGAYMAAILVSILRVRQILIHPQIFLDGDGEKKVWERMCLKFEILKANILTHPDEKSIVFCQFIPEMDKLEHELKEEGVVTFRLDGSVSGDNRKIQIDNFKNISHGAVFIIQVKAGGVGLNLQEATRVYITAPSWNGGTELQAIGRCHRTGQTKRVVVKKLLYETPDDCNYPSFDIGMVDLQRQKSVISAKLLNDHRICEQIPLKKKSTLSFNQMVNLFRKT